MAKAPPLEKNNDADDAAEEQEKETGEGGEGEAEAGAEGGDAPKKSKKKLLIIAVFAVLLIVGGVAGAYFGGLLGGGHEEESEVGEDGKPLEKPVFLTMPDFLINLSSTNKQTSFLKATIVLELAKSDDANHIEANMPRLLDTYNTYMRELRPSDLVGSAGIQRLREELLLRANKVLVPVKVKDVLFKEIIVQ
jgi:flagellar protein FliL